MGIAHGPLRRRRSGKGRAVPERYPRSRLRLSLSELVSTFAALVFVTVCAKGNKGNPSDQLTTQKAAIASARQNNRYRGQYQLRLDEARKIIQ
jgi:hypothetical protein